MTTIRQIITDAYREGGLIQIGTMPEADQLDEGLRKLQSIVTQLLGNEAGEGFETVVYGTGAGVNVYGQDQDKYDFINQYYVPSNVRLLVNTTSPKTVYLNPNPRAGARLSVQDVGGTFASGSFTLVGNGRKIDGGTQVVLSTANTNSQWFYRDDLSEWVKVTELEANDESPFPPEFDELLITSLAMRVNPRYQQQTSAETVQIYRQSKSQFRARYRQTEFVPSDVAQLFWNRLTTLDNNTTFNRGLIVG